MNRAVPAKCRDRFFTTASKVALDRLYANQSADVGTDFPGLFT